AGPGQPDLHHARRRQGVRRDREGDHARRPRVLAGCQRPALARQAARGSESDSTGGTVKGAETKMTVFKTARVVRRLLAACAIATAIGGGLTLAAAPAAAVRLVGVSA